MARKYSKRQPKAEVQAACAADCTALYIRVSTEKQVEEGFSLDSQKERLQAFATAQGWTVDNAHIYIDAGISGKSTDDRKAFNAMIGAANAGIVNRIVAMKLDRLARNVRDFLGIVDSLAAVGCDLVLVKESFDTSTPHGRFALTMFAAMAELEASTITERVMSGKAQKASVGGFNGSTIPFGYDYDGDSFAPTTAAPTVAGIFEAFTNGESMTGIAKQLNSEGNPTAKGGKWYASTVRYILQNGFYAGLTQWGDTETTGDHPAIISPALYETAHSRLRTMTPGPQAKA